MFVRNAWYIAAWGDELGDTPLARRICNDPIVLFRDRSGRAAALADRCCHRSAPLSLGTVVEDGIQCGYHGLIIDGAGKCVTVPGQRLIPGRGDACAAIRWSRRTSFLWIWMGDPALADPARSSISPITTTAPKLAAQARMYPIKGNYMLMVDNLMDLTHLGYLHAKTIGGNPSQHVEAEMKTTRTPDRGQVHPLDEEFGAAAELCQGGRVRRARRPLQASSSWRRRASCNGPARPTPARDGARRFRLQVPPVSRPDARDRDDLLLFLVGGQRLSPERAGGDRAALRQDRADLPRRRRKWFEAQQARLSEFGESGLVDIASDATRMTMRRHVDRMIAAEQQQQAAAE